MPQPQFRFNIPYFFSEIWNTLPPSACDCKSLIDLNVTSRLAVFSLILPPSSDPAANVLRFLPDVRRYVNHVLLTYMITKTSTLCFFMRHSVRLQNPEHATHGTKRKNAGILPSRHLPRDTCHRDTTPPPLKKSN